MKDHSSATKGSITSKNFDVFLTILTYSYRNTGKFEVFSWRKRRAFTKNLITWKYRLARSRERSIHDFTVSAAPVQNIDDILTVKFDMQSSGKWMTNNHEECSNDRTLKNLTCSVQMHNCRGCTYLCRKSREGTCFEVVSLAFSNFI